MSIPGQLSGPYGSLPLNLLLCAEFQSLSTSAKTAVLLVVARQNLHGGWSYSTRDLARDLGVSPHTARQAVTEASRSGILAVQDELDNYGVVSSRWFSVPGALPSGRHTIQPERKKAAHTPPPLSGFQTPPLSGFQTPPLSGFQTPSYIQEKDQEEDPPNPPLSRGATDRSRSGSRRKAPRIVLHPELGVVDLAKVPDPRLRDRDQRRIDALLAARAVGDAADVAEKAEQAQVASILGSCPSELGSMVETIETRLAASVLRSDHPARQSLRTLRDDAAHLWARAGSHLTVDEAKSLAQLARVTLDADALGETLSVLEAQDAAENAKQARIQPMLAELTGTLAGIESIVTELTMAMIGRKIGDPSARPVRARVFAVADRAKVARARLSSEWADEAELANVGAMLVELVTEAQVLRPLLHDV